MRARSSFTLLELLIVMSISTIIMMGMMQGQRNVMHFLDRAKILMSVNRRVCLLFNQIERDISTAHIPTLSEPIKKEKKGEEKGDKKKDTKEAMKQKTEEEKKEQKKEKQKPVAFHVSIKEGMAQRLACRKRELLQRV